MNSTRYLLPLSAALVCLAAQAAAPSTDIPAAVMNVAKAQITSGTLRAPIRYLAATLVDAAARSSLDARQRGGSVPLPATALCSGVGWRRRSIDLGRK